MALQSFKKGLLLTRAPLTLGCRTLVGKSRRGEIQRPKPFPHETKDYYVWHELWDRTTTRFDDNTKVIVVDGAHAIGKTNFAQELANEFDMKLFSDPSVSKTFINYYGEDLHDYSAYMNPMNKPYDEKDFSRNPNGPMEGAGDRFHIDAIMEKLRNYVYALKHLYSTGQGVVVEGNPWSDYAHFEAAYNQGWVTREARKVYKDGCYHTLWLLMRPHLILYLDAPVDVVMSNIKKRNNPWDKDSPVWTNKRYLTDIYTEKKRRYLLEQQRHSHVLVYDWSSPGEIDIVVDDIEKLEMDYVDEYDDLLRDWTRNRSEQLHMVQRRLYCNLRSRKEVLNLFFDLNRDILDADNLYKDREDYEQMEDVLSHIKSERYAPGSNPYMGDKHVWAKIDPFVAAENATRYQNYLRYRFPRLFFPFTDDKNIHLEPIKSKE